ncbi:MAG: NHL repeat-containing protein [Ardenticatenaceae bacterium]|nr:NHL repeat-containing protein [Ardenticatenaceae bacterium]
MPELSVSISSSSPSVPQPSFAPPRDLGYRPELWLGAPSRFGLALPDASPTAVNMYAPRGVYFDDEVLIVSDTGNHRLMIWQGMPTEDHAPADVVLGQPDFFDEGPNAAGRGPANGVHLPTGVLVAEGQLFVADAWNHRILVWHSVPERSFTPPDYALGQSDLDSVVENRGGGITATGLYWPYGIAFINGQFFVTDTGNRRVLVWNGLPAADQPPDLIMGQDAPDLGLENRGTGVAANTFRWPHDVAGNDEVVYIADAGNHRILGWRLPLSDRPADFLLGQPDFERAVEWPYGSQGPSALRFPYAIALQDQHLLSADTANNRILIWDGLPDGIFQPAAGVLGQPDFAGGGENRWQAVGRDTMCWPYGIHVHGRRVAVADSGNNRVMIWQR